MGLPMLARLKAAGRTVLGLDVRPPEAFGALAPVITADPRRLATDCPVVVSLVRDRAQTEAVCFGPDGLFTRAPYPALLIIASTLAPDDLRTLAARVPDGVAVVDAAVSGAPVAAEQGTLTVMMGGSDEAMESAAGVLSPVTGALYKLGPLGSGMTAKVINNFVGASTVLAVRQAFAAADACGLDWRTLQQLMSRSSGATWYGSNFDSIDWARQGYAPDNTIAIIEKDVKAYLSTALAAEARDAPSTFERAVLEGLRSLTPETR